MYKVVWNNIGQQVTYRHLLCSVILSPSSKRVEQLVDQREGIVLTPKNVQVRSSFLFLILKLPRLVLLLLLCQNSIFCSILNNSSLSVNTFIYRL